MRYIGDDVAAVCAVDPEIAEEALELIRVDYEELPAVFDPLEAIKEGAPLIHDGVPHNTSFSIHKEFGNVEKAFQESDFVFEDRFYSQAVNHAPLEPHAAVAQYDPLKGEIILYSSTQIPFFLRRNLACDPDDSRKQGPGDQAQSRGRFRPENRHVRQGFLRRLVRPPDRKTR